MLELDKFKKLVDIAPLVSIDFIIKNQIKQACLKYLTSIDYGYLKAYQTWVEHVHKQNVA